MQAIADLILEVSFLAFVSLVFLSPKASQVALIPLSLSWIVRRLAAPSFLPKVPLQLALFIYLSSLLLSALFSEIRPHSLHQFFSQGSKLLAIYFGALEYLRDQSRYRRLLWTGTFVLLIIGVDGLSQALLGRDLILGAGVIAGRIRAHFHSPTFFEYVLPLFPFPLLLLESESGWWKRILLGLSFMAFGTSCVLSQTRSVWISLALSFTLVALSSCHRALYGLLIGFLALLLIVLPLSGGKERFYSIGDFFSEQRYQRILSWQIAYRMFLSQPLLGKGPDIFHKYKRNAELQKPYVPPALWERIQKGGGEVIYPVYHPHSIYLELLASQGLFGLTGFLCVLFTLFRNIWKRRGPPSSRLVIGISASFLSFLVCGALGSSIYNYWSFSIFWLLAGMGMALYGERRIGEQRAEI